MSLNKLSDTEPDLEQIGFRLSKYEISWMTCLLDFGNFSSPILACVLMDKIGRKYALLLSSVFYCVPTLFLIYPDVMSLYISRFSVGFAKGMAFTILPLYISEVSDSRIRGTLVALGSSQMYVGLLLVLFIGPLISLKTLSISLCALPYIFMALFSFMPESPYHLAVQQKYKASRESLKWFRGNNNIDDEFESIVRKSKADMEEGSSFTQLFTNPANRKALFIVLVISFFQRLGGITSLIVFGPKTFPETNISLLNPAHSSIIVMLSIIAGSVIQFRLSDVMGRRALLGFSSITVSIVLLLISIYFIFPSMDYSYLVYVLIVMYGFSYNGIGAVPFILLGELFPMNIRCQSSSVAAVAMAAGSFITNKFHLLLVTYTNTCVIFLFYSFINLLTFLFTMKYVFETKCKTFEEIQELLQKSLKSSPKKL